MISTSYSQLRAAGDLEELGRGNEGIVYQLPDPARVYKEYVGQSATTPTATALDRLIRIRASVSDADRAFLDVHAAWPESAVVDGQQLRGCVMKRIPARMYRRYGARLYPRTVPCNWNYFSFQASTAGNPNIIDEIPVLDAGDTWKLILDLSKLIELLHRHDVILGDISGGNLLWTDAPTPQAYLIDCDSFRVSGTAGVGTPKQSPDWDDPHLGGTPTTKESDVYKLALAAFRAIARAETDRPGPDLSSGYLAPFCPNPASAEVLASLIAASAGPTGRPTAAEWVRELTTGRRPRIPMPVTPVRPEELPSPRPRGRIPLNRADPT